MIPLVNATDPARYGGKAATLATLMRTGVPVPDGIVLSAPSVADAALGKNPRLLDQIAEWAAPRAPYGVVVRSSALEEDGVDASFAGLFASCFVPATTADIGRAISTVHASVFSEAVTSYAHARGLPAPLGTAVLIQPALRAAASGVLFPAWGTGWRIEATLGLSVLLLNGEVAPDVYQSADGKRQDRTTIKHVSVLPLTAQERELPPGEWLNWPHKGRSKLVFSDDGLGYVRPSTVLGKQPVLDHAAVHEVQLLGRWAQALLGQNALDIEWVQDTDGVFWLVQARPATSAECGMPSSAVSGRDVLVGEAASCGSATGPATVITDVSQAGRMPDGGVLVCCSARPELVPAIIKASGIACTDAGILCHTAILARELAKPCVTGVLDAPEIIRNGQDVTVDGSNGIVRLHDLGDSVPDVPTRPQPSITGMRVVTGPGHEGPVVLAVDHGTALDQAGHINVAGLLYPPGSTVTEPAIHLPGGARLRWLSTPQPFDGTLWAGISDGPRTVLHLEER